MWSAISKGFKMAKRYHQSKRDRMHERRGEEMYMARMRKEHADARGARENYGTDKYGTDTSHMDSRRREAMARDGMLHNDNSQTANMPQEIVMRGYGRIHGFLPESIDDSRHEIEREIRDTDRKSMQQFAPKKW